MKKINKIHEEEERRRKEFIRRMEYEKHKIGITKTKYDYEEAKARRYVRNINEMYAVISPEKHLEITEGTKREGIKYCGTKSQWKYNREELEKQGKVKPEIEEIKDNSKEEKIILPRRKEKIMLVVGEKIYILDVEISPSEEEFYTEIKIGKEKNKIKIRRTFLEEEKKYRTIHGEMSSKTLLQIYIRTGVKIYEIV